MSDWILQPLGELAVKISTGSTPSTTRQEFFGGAVQWFTPADIGARKKLIASTRTITPEALKNGKARLFEKTSLLVTCIGEIGRVGVLQQPSSSNQQITAIKFSDDVDENFAYYWFVANKNQLTQRANHALVPILNNERLKEIVFSYPSLAEQQGIAAILDRADHLRHTRRYAAQLSETFLQAVFVRMFGDPRTNPMGWTISNLGELMSIPPHIGTPTPSEDSGEQLCVRVGEVGNWYVDLNSCKYISLTGHELERFTLLPGDIVLARAIGSESHLGKLSILQKISQPIVFDSHLMRLRTNEILLSNIFLAVWLRTDGGRARFMYQARRTAVQFNINSEQISEIEIPLPPLALQEKFAHIAQQFERLRAQQREAERQAEHLFQTLLHKAFSG